MFNKMPVILISQELDYDNFHFLVLASLQFLKWLQNHVEPFQRKKIKPMHC